MSDNMLRQSQVITTFGPGSLVDLPNRSVIIGGLAGWDRGGRTEIHEPRLVEKLRRALNAPTLQLFTPPALDESPGAPKNGISARIFPTWFVTQDLAAKPGTYRRRRLVGMATTAKNGLEYQDPDDGKRKRLTPVRFVCACRRGHTDDVDWRVFVHREKAECTRTLWVEERGTSGDIADTWVGCDCGAQRRLYEALDLATIPLGYCNGKRPWLGFGGTEDCKEPSRLLMRTASNAYFAETLSVVSLPDEDEGVSARLDEVWDFLESVETFEELGTYRKNKKVKAALDGLTDAEIMEAIQRRRGAVADVSVKEAEFGVLASGRKIIGRDARDSTFYAETLDRATWDPKSAPHLKAIQRLVLVHRLREVVAQVGFTRFEAAAPLMDGDIDMQVERQLLDREISWLPAVEHRGEGLFLQIDKAEVETWLQRPGVQQRVDALSHAYGIWAAERKIDRLFVGGPYVMLHSLSHLLMTAISLECGYPASSLRERIYAFPKTGCFGILIHTGTSGADGTLGGLVEAGRRLGEHVSRALSMAGLCSNDPVCADHAPDDSHEDRYLHGAACHGCLLVAETSCEQRNDLLDRALVVPTVSVVDAAFFPKVS